MGEADKGGMGEADKGKVDEANIKADKKAGAEAFPSTNNSANDGDKVTDQCASLAGLAFPAFVAANYTKNSNLIVPKGTPLNAATSTPDEFLTTFAALANTTLKRKPKVCESNPFLFAANHQ